MANINEVKDFSDVMSDTVIVDVWASWCMPCKQMAPIFDDLSDKFDKIKFMKCNVDDFQQFAQTYNIRSIPTFIIFQDGILKEQIVGVCTKNHLEKVLKRYGKK